MYDANVVQPKASLEMLTKWTQGKLATTEIEGQLEQTKAKPYLWPSHSIEASWQALFRKPSELTANRQTCAGKSSKQSMNPVNKGAPS